MGGNGGGPPDKPGVLIITSTGDAQQLHDDLEKALVDGYDVLASVGQFVILAKGYEPQ